MIHFIKKGCWIVCLTSTLSVYAQSQVGSFNATVDIQGPVNQTATGNSVKQDLNVGSAQKSKANSFSSTVTTGSITQTGRNGAQQIINVGGMNNSQADKFDAKVSTGNIEQIANHGEKQELDIGSVSNSTVSGTATTRVSVGAVKQTGEGEIALGALKNSNVQQFKSDLVIGGKLEGNNIRMGSVVNQEKYNNNGKYTGKEALGSTTQSPQIQMPNFEIASRKDQISPIAEQESIQSPKYNIIEEIQTNSKLLDNISPTYKPWNELRNSEKIAVNLLIEAKPYAELASASYDFNKKSVGDWDLIETEGDNLQVNGLQFGVYKNKNSNETVIAFRGTELPSVVDILNDFQGPLYGLNTPQFKIAYKKVADLISSGKLPDINNIKLVGHSLGGGLAQAVGATFGLETYAFNSAKVPAGFFNTHPIKLSSNLLQKKIHVISDVKDIISNGNLSTSTNYAINGLTSSHVTTNIQFDFDKKNVSPIFGEKAQSTSFSHHGIDKLINNLSELQDKYSSK